MMNKHNESPSYLQPPSDAQDLMAATHPSDHNAVYAFHHKRQSEWARKRREAKLQKRRMRELKKGNTRGAQRDDACRFTDHQAFLFPVPLYFAMPLGIGGGGCAAYAGHVVDGGNGGGCASVSIVLFWVLLQAGFC
jgi:hypothetical protein